jgi:hypothetical protein
MKYEILASYHHKQTFFGKIKGLSSLGFEPKLDIFKTCKNLCTTLKRLIETEYEPHWDKIRISSLFLP